MHTSKAICGTVNRTKSNVGEQHYGDLIQNAKGELKALRKVKLILTPLGLELGFKQEFDM